MTARRLDSTRPFLRLLLVAAQWASACSDSAEPMVRRLWALEDALPDASSLGEGWEALSAGEGLPPPTRPDAAFCNLGPSKVAEADESAQREFEDQDEGRAGVSLYRFGSAAAATARLQEYVARGRTCRAFTFVIPDDGKMLPATLAGVETAAVGDRGQCYVLSLTEDDNTGWFGVCIVAMGRHLVHTRSQSYERSRASAIELASGLAAAAVAEIERESD